MEVNNPLITVGMAIIQSPLSLISIIGDRFARTIGYLAAEILIIWNVGVFPILKNSPGNARGRFCLRLPFGMDPRG